MENETPTWKKVLAVFGVLSLLGLVAVVILGFWLKRAAENMLVSVQTDLPAIAEEGVRYAASHSQAECLEAGLEKAVQCGTMEITCHVGANLFGQSCVEAATPDPAFCEAVPASEGHPHIAAWTAEECAKRGHEESAQCTAYLNQVAVKFCAGKLGGE